MRVYGISWVGVKTDSYRAMRDFFAETAGLRLDGERGEFAVFGLPDGGKVEIFGAGADDPPEQFAREKVVAGLLVDDVAAAAAELREAGIELIGPVEDGGGGYRWQHFRAPDGKVFELVQNPVALRGAREAG
jgi:predicted enzyme related to lactoylglutathione lyase